MAVFTVMAVAPFSDNFERYYKASLRLWCGSVGAGAGAFRATIQVRSLLFEIV